MVTLVNVTQSATYTATVNVDLQWNKTVNLTVVPMPLSDSPVILNYGGCQEQLQISFDLMATVDAQTIYTYFQSAAGNQYNLVIPEWGIGTVSAYPYSCQIQQVPGEGGHWTVQLVYYIGTLM